jgi:hypothetical protein
MAANGIRAHIEVTREIPPVRRAKIAGCPYLKYRYPNSIIGNRPEFLYDSAVGQPQKSPCFFQRAKNTSPQAQALPKRADYERECWSPKLGPIASQCVLQLTLSGRNASVDGNKKAHSKDRGAKLEREIHNG